MAKRFKDKVFDLGDDQGNIGTWEKVGIAALYDIRDELKALNQTLSILKCRNFLEIPFKLDRIERNTLRPKKKRQIGKPKLSVVRA